MAGTLRPWAAGLLIASTVGLPTVASGASKGLPDVEAEIRELHEQNQRNQQRIKELEDTVRELKAQQAEKPKAAEQAKAQEPSPDVMRRALDRYWGEHRFMITGYGSGRWEWNDNERANTFTAGINPILLFRLNDRLLFSSELEVKLPSDAESEVFLEYAQADYLLNDYVTVRGGKFLLPFGEFIERVHPPWINKLVTHPLPFREGDEGGILPFSDIGVQLRGAVPLGWGDGTNVEYTVYGANGPRFEVGTDDARGAVGDGFSQNNVDSNRGKAGGARVGIRPLPLGWDAGRLHLGASTYDGEWDSRGSLLFASWGLDAAYQYGDAELRGEYVNTHRELAGPTNDNREGWYLQAAYQLASLVPAPWNRLEFVGRYSFQNQRRAPEEQPPHPRQWALGVDYWITPSVALKLEYDRDVPRGAPDNNKLLTQFAIGF
jgi:Gram-negative porin